MQVEGKIRTPEVESAAPISAAQFSHLRHEVADPSKMQSLLRVATRLTDLDKDMPLTRLQVLLIVAMIPGCTVKEIVRRTGLNQSTVSRSLALLSDRPVRGQKDGFGWVVTRRDPRDSRRCLCYVTRSGEKMLTELENLV